MILEFKDFNICLVTDDSSMVFHDEDSYEHVYSDHDPMDFLLRVPDYLIERAANLDQYNIWMNEINPTISEIVGSVSTYQKQFDDVYLEEE